MLVLGGEAGPSESDPSVGTKTAVSVPVFGATLTSVCDIIVSDIVRVFRTGGLEESESHGSPTSSPAANTPSDDPASQEAQNALAAFKESALKDLKGRLCWYRNNLYMAYQLDFSCGCPFQGEGRGHLVKGKTTCGLDGHSHDGSHLQLHLRKCKEMRYDYPDSKVAARKDRDDLLFATDYCFNFIKIASVLSQLLQEVTAARDTGSPQPYPILSFLVDPVVGCQTQARYSSAPDGDDEPTEESLVPKVNGILNDKQDAVTLCPAQLSILNAFSHALELVHGPPGTGKSTCIRSTVRHHLPTADRDVVLILAVQNRAVDVLVSMFEPFVDSNPSTSDMGMLVVGAAKKINMGVSAKKYTLGEILEENAEYCELKKRYVDFCGSSNGKKQLWKELDRLQKKLCKHVCQSVSLVFSTFDESHKIRTGAKHWRGLAGR